MKNRDYITVETKNGMYYIKLNATLTLTTDIELVLIVKSFDKKSVYCQVANSTQKYQLMRKQIGYLVENGNLR